jgi:succinate dehydrogenase/fumarate reductase-like Fe-S protein
MEEREFAQKEKDIIQQQMQQMMQREQELQSMGSGNEKELHELQSNIQMGQQRMHDLDDCISHGCCSDD